MGFFSSVGHMFSAVGHAVSTAISGLGTAFKAVGGAVGSLATTIGGALGLSIAKFIPVIGDIVLVIDCIVAVANLLGIFTKEESVEELGMKAEMAEKKPEDFDSTEEYINYLREEIEIDKNNFENMSEEQLVAYKVAGSAILLGGISEKKAMDIDPKFISAVANIGVKGEQLNTVLDKFKELKAKTDLDGYFSGKLSMKDDTKISNALESSLKEINPKMTEDEYFDKMTQMRDHLIKEEI